MLELILGLRAPHCGLRGIYIGIRSSGMCGRMGEDTDVLKLTPVADMTGHLIGPLGPLPKKSLKEIRIENKREAKVENKRKRK